MSFLEKVDLVWAALSGHWSEVKGRARDTFNYIQSFVSYFLPNFPT